MARCYQDAYIQCALGMRNMYRKCRLVHGDLSEYNLLYMDGVLIFIDVSQVLHSLIDVLFPRLVVGLRVTSLA